MANRHLSRTLALQSLFQWDFYGKQPNQLKKILERNFQEFAPDFDDGNFLYYIYFKRLFHIVIFVELTIYTSEVSVII